MNQHCNVLPAKHPFIAFPKLHSPLPLRKNFQISRLVIPPVPHAINVDTTAQPIAVPSPSSLTDA